MSKITYTVTKKVGEVHISRQLEIDEEPQYTAQVKELMTHLEQAVHTPFNKEKVD